MLRVGIDNIERGSFFEELHLGSQVIWQPAIVTIEKGDVGAACLTNSEVTCGAGPPVVLLEIENALSKGSQHLFQFVTVWGAVIDNDHFEVTKGLRENRL